MAASFHTLTLDAGSDSITTAAVKTRAASVRQRTLQYAYPGLSGAGAVAQGITPVPIDLTIQLEFPSLATLTAWEAKVRTELRTGGRYTLTDELGLTYANCWLMDYSRSDVNPILGGSGAYLLEAVLSFGWLQP